MRVDAPRQKYFPLMADGIRGQCRDLRKARRPMSFFQQTVFGLAADVRPGVAESLDAREFELQRGRPQIGINARPKNGIGNFGSFDHTGY